jgi:hypothetical protein
MVNNIDGLSDENKERIKNIIGERIKYDYKKYLTDDNVRFEFTYK